MSKYLIIKCEELGDQYECDTIKTPVKITDDFSKYGSGYEVWEILKNGDLKKIKEYDTILEEGFAIYYWENDEDEDNVKPHVIKKFKNMTRNDVTKSLVTKIKKLYGFAEPTEDIYAELQSCGLHGEEVYNRFLLLGEYSGNYYSRY